MRLSFNSLLFVGIPVFLSATLLATSSFGQQAPGPDHGPLPPAWAGAVPGVPPEEVLNHLKKYGDMQRKQWAELLREVELAVNLLSGNETNLLSGNKPELLSKNKAELLSDNKTELLSKNNPKLLSDNKQKILSNNKTAILSGNHFSFFSGLKIEIHIDNVGNNSGNRNDAPAAPSRPERVMLPQQGAYAPVLPAHPTPAVDERPVDMRPEAPVDAAR
jgi:hypothetical protein